MTLLFQREGQPGLEVQTPQSSGGSGGRPWLPVAVQPAGAAHDPFPPLVVNIGDMLSDWTAGLLRSTLHRVVIPRRRVDDRYSVAFFCHPVATTELSPVPSRLMEERGRAIDGGRKDEGKVLTAAEHLQRRLAETYGWAKDAPQR